MENVLFKHSEVANPYAIYADRLTHTPIFYDAPRNIWAVYRYADCQAILHHPAAQIPPVAMNEQAITKNLVRLSNPPNHPEIRSLTMALYGKMRPVNIEALLDTLISGEEIEWVSAVAKKLPALSLLTAFGFSPDDAACILPHVETLTQLMLPTKNEVQAQVINGAVQMVYPLVQYHLTHQLGFSEDALPILVANLIGLLIQSFDATRGLLTTSLYRALEKDSPPADMQKFVMEVLRFDSPVHNTRRILGEGVVIDGVEIPAGATVLIVLAAANRDPRQFDRPDEFNVHRSNNESLLTFGSGPHACLARDYCVNLTATALNYLFTRFPSVTRLSESIEYEPLINVRLPKILHIHL